MANETMVILKSVYQTSLLSDSLENVQSSIRVLLTDEEAAIVEKTVEKIKANKTEE